MGIKLADTLEPMGNFPAVESNNVNIDIDGTSKSIQQAYEDGDLSGGGSSIQVDTMPVASIDEVGKIYQYIGEDGTYRKGHFYECVHNKCDVQQPVYWWMNVSSYRYNHVIYNQTTEPINSDFIASDIIYYTGVLTDKFKPNHYYRALPSIGTMEKYTFTMYKNTYGGMVFWSYTPFEFRRGFIVYPTSGGGEWTPYEITSITDEKVTITPCGDWGGEPLEFDGILYTSEVKDWEELENGNPVIEDVNVLPTSSDIENRIYRTKSVSPQTIEVLLVIPANVTQNERLIACTNTLSTWTVSGATLYPPKDEYWKWNDKEMYSITCDSTRTVFTTKTQSGTQDDAYSIEVAWSSNFYVSPYEKAIYAGDKDMETNDRLALYSDISGNIFNGTMDEWNALTTEQKKEYDNLATLEDFTTEDVATVSNPFTRDTTHTQTASEIQAFKQGRIASFKVYVEFKNIEEGRWNNIGTVVNAIKPLGETPLIISDGRVATAMALARIYTDGKVQVWGSSTLNTLSTRLSAMYFTAN